MELKKMEGNSTTYSQKMCFDKFFAWKEYNFPPGFLTNTILNFAQECNFPAFDCGIRIILKGNINLEIRQFTKIRQFTI